MVLIDFLKKAWTIVHDFDRFFENHGLIVRGFNRKSWF